MLTYLSSSIWASPAQRLVKTVNVAGRWHPSKLEYVEAGLNKFAEPLTQQWCNMHEAQQMDQDIKEQLAMIGFKI